MALEMRHCMQCGTKLEMKYLPSEGREIPYCPVCGDYRFPIFNTAVSMIVENEAHDHILLIRQYGRDTFVLVAGYINKGEDAEHAAVREVLEETGLRVTSCRFNHSHYFAPSNTLMLNWTVTVESMDVHANEEVDSYQWFTVEEARANIRPDSLAQTFLEGYLTGKYPW